MGTLKNKRVLADPPRTIGTQTKNLDEILAIPGNMLPEAMQKLLYFAVIVSGVDIEFGK